MATAKQVYDANIKLIEDKISEIVETNRADISRIPELKQEYKAAINAFDIEKGDTINAEIDRLERTAAVRKKQIDALKDPGHPARVEAKDLYVKGLDAEKEAIKTECQPLIDEIKAARDAYMELAVKIIPIEERFFGNAREKHRVLFPKDPMTIIPHGLPGTIHDCLIEKYHLLNKDKEVRKEKYEQMEREFRALRSL